MEKRISIHVIEALKELHVTYLGGVELLRLGKFVVTSPLVAASKIDPSRDPIAHLVDTARNVSLPFSGFSLNISRLLTNRKTQNR